MQWVGKGGGTMSTLREAAQAALEALSDFVSLSNLAAHNGQPVHLVREAPIMRHAEKTCAALRAAIRGSKT